MPIRAPTVVCHAGSGSNPAHADGPTLACGQGLQAIADGEGALAAAAAATRWLEDDERFNAGTGSNLRLDGRTIQMDAACMTGSGEFGAVAAIEGVKNPVDVALLVLGTPHILLAGEGATAFARRAGFGPFDPTTPGARERWAAATSGTGLVGEWNRADLERAWNFDLPLGEALDGGRETPGSHRDAPGSHGDAPGSRRDTPGSRRDTPGSRPEAAGDDLEASGRARHRSQPDRAARGSDTVGCVAWDGEHFAGTLSSGGTTTVLRGRVGDVPLPGCGLYAGEHGAVAATGDGEHIARVLLAYRAHEELARGRTSEQVVEWALAQLAPEVDVGLVVLGRAGFAGGARHGMAWHGASTEVEA